MSFPPQNTISTFFTITLTTLLYLASLGISVHQVTQASEEKHMPKIPAFGHPSQQKIADHWKLKKLPEEDSIPVTDFAIVSLKDNEEPVLRMQAESSYGALAFDIEDSYIPDPKVVLHWRWRLDQAIEGVDLYTKEGDDAVLKVCASFNMSTQGLPFGERFLLSLARGLSQEDLPAATLCYLWDPSLVAGTSLPNAYTKRVRFVILDGKDTPLGSWQPHSRNLHQDFIQYFGSESDTVPPLQAILVGADADNTKGNSLAYIKDIHLISEEEK